MGLVVRLGALVLALVLAGPASAGFYKWVDENGKLHFAQDLTQVPVRYRAQAEANSKKASGPSRVQKIESPGPARVAPRSRTGSASGVGKKSYTIRVQRAGTSMRVMVRINNSLDVPFIIDTGASDVTLPEWAVERLNLDLSEARTQVYQTANGLVESPVVVLQSVQLGGARADSVPASVSSSMDIGLLGLTFFNRFNYNIDAARGLVTLTPNDLEETGGIRGGRSEAQWRTAYRHLAARMRRVEAEADRTPDSRSREHARLEALMEELERQLEKLDEEADLAKVPFAWRE